MIVSNEDVVRLEGEILEKRTSDQILARIQAAKTRNVAAAQPFVVKIQQPQISEAAKNAVAAVRGTSGHYACDADEGAGQVQRSYLLPFPDVSSPADYQGSFGKISRKIYENVGAVQRNSEGGSVERKAINVVKYLLDLLGNLYEGFESEPGKRLPSPHYSGKNSDGRVADAGAWDFFEKQGDAILVFVKGLQDLMRLRGTDTIVDLAVMLRDINHAFVVAVEEQLITAVQRKALDEFVQCALGGLIQDDYVTQGVARPWTRDEGALRDLRNEVMDEFTDDEVIVKIQSGEAYCAIMERKAGYTDPEISDEDRLDIINGIIAQPVHASYVNVIKADVENGAYNIDIREAYNELGVFGGNGYDADLQHLVDASVAQEAQKMALNEKRKATGQLYNKTSDTDLLRQVGTRPDFKALVTRFESDARVVATLRVEAELRSTVISRIVEIIESVNDVFDAPNCIRKVFLDQSSLAYRQFALKSDHLLDDRDAERLVDGSMGTARAEMVDAKVDAIVENARSNEFNLYGVPVWLSAEAKEALTNAVVECGESARRYYNKYLFLNPVVGQ